jgi:hypothetical protein
MSIDVSQILWPLVVLILLGIVFRKPITELLSRLTKLALSKDSVSFEVGELERVAEEFSIAAEHAKSLKQGNPYNDYSDALQDVERKIRDCIQDGIARGIEAPKVELKLMAVAMTFSWNFVVTKIPRILQDFPKAQIEIKVVFVDPEHLASLNLAAYEIDWVQESRQRVKEAQEFAKLCQQQFRARILFTVKVYRNLPHWHGWLVDDKYLFLGRTNWDFLNHYPKLLVGQNKYRYFDTSSAEGSERIDLYKHWHRYYFASSSDAVCDTSKPSAST